MKTITQRTTFYILRFFRLRDKKVLYAYNTGKWAHRRDWWYSKNERRAYHFNHRGDARGALRSVSFQVDLLNPRSNLGYGCGAEEDRSERAYFFEIVQVVETTTKIYAEAIEVTDAPAMIVLGRSAQ